MAIWIVFYYTCFCLFVASIKAGRFRLIALAAFLLTLIGIFWRPAQPPLTVACFDDCVVVVDAQHHATVIGDTKDKSKDKLLSYLSANVDPSDTNFCRVAKRRHNNRHRQANKTNNNDCKKLCPIDLSKCRSNAKLRNCHNPEPAKDH